MTRRLSDQTLVLLRELAIAPNDWRYGYELGHEVGLKAGTLYPILMRLSDRGLLEATWEPDPPTGRPRRHMYRILPEGLAEVGVQRSTVFPDRSPMQNSVRRLWYSGRRMVTKTDTRRDGANRALSLAVRLLPPARREWGDAMQAELAAIERGPARRRYALGCARAVCARPGSAAASGVDRRSSGLRHHRTRTLVRNSVAGHPDGGDHLHSVSLLLLRARTAERIPRTGR